MPPFRAPQSTKPTCPLVTIAPAHLDKTCVSSYRRIRFEHPQRHAIGAPAWMGRRSASDPEQIVFCCFQPGGEKQDAVQPDTESSADHRRDFQIDVLHNVIIDRHDSEVPWLRLCKRGSTDGGSGESRAPRCAKAVRPLPAPFRRRCIRPASRSANAAGNLAQQHADSDLRDRNVYGQRRDSWWWHDRYGRRLRVFSGRRRRWGRQSAGRRWPGQWRKRRREGFRRLHTRD